MVSTIYNNELEYLSLSIILILLLVIGLRKHEGSRSISFSDFVYQGPKKFISGYELYKQ